MLAEPERRAVPSCRMPSRRATAMLRTLPTLVRHSTRRMPRSRIAQSTIAGRRAGHQAPALGGRFQPAARLGHPGRTAAERHEQHPADHDAVVARSPRCPRRSAAHWSAERTATRRPPDRCPTGGAHRWHLLRGRGPDGPGTAGQGASGAGVLGRATATPGRVDRAGAQRDSAGPASGADSPATGEPARAVEPAGRACRPHAVGTGRVARPGGASNRARRRAPAPVATLPDVKSGPAVGVAGAAEPVPDGCRSRRQPGRPAGRGSATSTKTIAIARRERSASRRRTSGPPILEAGPARGAPVRLASARSAAGQVGRLTGAATTARFGER